MHPRNRERAELKAAVYAVTLEKEGWPRAKAVARARAAYGLRDDDGTIEEPTLSTKWRKEMMQELAEGHPRAESGRSEAQVMREYRKRRKSG